MRALRSVIYAVAALIGIAGVGLAGVLMTFDPNAYKPAIQDAVQRATGRALVLNGRMRLQLSLRPTLHVDDVAFANPPGFSRPEMATLRGLDIRIALLPLLHGALNIDQLILLQPDILLEIAANGQPNWRMTPAEALGQTAAGQTAAGQIAGGGAPSGQAPSAQTPQEQTSQDQTSQDQTSQDQISSGQSGWRITSVAVSAVTIEDGKLAWFNRQTGVRQEIAVQRMDGAAGSSEEPVHLRLVGRYDGQPFDLTAETGSAARFLAGDKAWRAMLTLGIAGAQLTGDATVDTAALTFDAAFSGRVPDSAAVRSLVPLAGQVPLQDLAFSGRASGRAGSRVAVRDVRVHVGAGDLSSLVAGLHLVSLDLAAPGADRPMQVTASLTRAGVPVSLSGSAGAPFALLYGDPLPALPIDLTVTSGDAEVSAKGSIADARALSGVALDVTARIPHFDALSPLLGVDLPRFSQIVLRGALSDLPGGLQAGVQVRGLDLRAAHADAVGDVSVALAPHRSIVAHLRGDRLDIDALQQSFGITEATAPAGPPATASPATPSAGGAAESSGHSADRSAAHANGRIFADTALPFGLLKTTDADVTLDVGTIRASGGETRSASLHLALRDGRLTVDRFTADLPVGRMSGSFFADATQAEPPVRLRLHAPGLALSSTLGWFGYRRVASGQLEVYADLAGAGVSPHAIAASLDGTLGVAVAGGTFDNRALGAVLGRVLAAVNILDLVGKGGNSELRCFAARAVAHHGAVTIDPLLLSSSLLTMSGAGSANLADETVNLGLRPQVKLLATDMVVPVRVSGPMRQPSVAAEKTAVAQAGVSTVTGALVGQNSPVALLGGLLGVNKALGIGGDPCPAALAAARAGGGHADAASSGVGPTGVVPSGMGASDTAAGAGAAGQGAADAGARGQGAAPQATNPPAQADGKPPKRPIFPNLPDPGAALKSLFR